MRNLALFQKISPDNLSFKNRVKKKHYPILLTSFESLDINCKG